ncbi:DNA polymerase lambda [Bisporella sp. PMI_857]|nr:DNA polymerase lambda [Bisporella sp. PMI_857]
MLDDRISADAKSKAMAAVAAYPYTITSWHEVERLPGCGPSHAALFEEWKTTGRIREVDELKHDEKFQSLKIFYDIYDVAEKTARDFYRRGWRDLDDLIMNWESLTENQRVGVKYYDDFKEKIPRAEVEQIGAVVLQYANKIQKGFQMVITGGYRRGKSMSGDVDVILTHPDKEATKDFIDEIVYDLGKDLWITQRLSLTTRNSHRGQAPVTWKGSMPRSGSGFDTLDKALVVWQNASLLLPDGKPDPNVRNPKRRVDIIISPWKTAGCAILGWSGGTQFERDLRKYVRTLNPPLKFDSTGVVNRETGKWIDFEGDETDLLEKEKKVFKGLKLEWRDPTERCTG